MEAREEVALEPRPLTPLVVGVIGAGRRATHDPATGLGVDFGLMREGKSPSERIFGGVFGLRGRLAVDWEDSGWESASNWRRWAGESLV